MTIGPVATSAFGAFTIVVRGNVHGCTEGERPIRVWASAVQQTV